ncbi:alanine/glycine:cation symporter family protein [Duncaniella muris]|jgi:AGCS family alanine or glycine:cation symporter|uniref:alanine/glycine:cation symporter family protein n=4 Tax=Duncaniella muris TaxID=2094150 RepID=UPI000F4A4AC3|nr:alanine/glycine:cation symporter family protein [Duncaniella muris]NBH91432.1 alanine:cation symporter family protein [Muribaculaceae bacterium S4]NBI19754.1 alanine:cation symporter family protein [Muribaculaceae bacterium Z1]ROS97046.1 alanine:cation symporter family protein [Muribaculaceae bacterium Isolate-077 (Janvier)]ROS99711.1 alanine:cation symporter family protein [Muribaculaceae bacterium Isolate-083 (Janvier)]ROT00972.1 alanine:cation symporter family protein [Muribaculaceae bac
MDPSSGFSTALQNAVNAVSGVLTDYVLVTVLLIVAVVFTVRTRGVQFRMAGEMLHLLVRSGKRDNDRRQNDAPAHGNISSFQAFALSIASRVGTGNLAGVASAIALGGPGAVFWMWVIAILGAASAFVESTLAQLFKVKGDKSFRGGPAYYILKGLHKRWWAVTFAVLITLTFGFAFNSVQSNTISDALNASFAIPREATAGVLCLLTLAIICGGVQRISRVSEIVVPVMAIAYIVLALVIIAMNIGRFPEIMMLIVSNAFGADEILGGSVGAAMVMGIKRGLFSNEAGEGSTPNAAATASVSHPVKQGLIQTLGVYTDTLLVCTATAFIILCSGIYTGGHDGIVLTQQAIDAGLGGDHRFGSIFVSVAIFFFAFTSIIANYYYGETNIRFIRNSNLAVRIYRLLVAAIVYAGAVVSLDLVWGFADITMALMTLCNLAAIIMLGKYAIRLLKDYQDQKREGKDPVYRSSTIPEIASETECWE